MVGVETTCIASGANASAWQNLANLQGIVRSSYHAFYHNIPSRLCSSELIFNTAISIRLQVVLRLELCNWHGTLGIECRCPSRAERGLSPGDARERRAKRQHFPRGRSTRLPSWSTACSRSVIVVSTPLEPQTAHNSSTQ
jgi:hypothetical protein